MHGIALYYLLNKQQRTLSIKLAFRMPLRHYSQMCSDHQATWDNMENISFRDRFRSAFYHKFHDDFMNINTLDRHKHLVTKTPSLIVDTEDSKNWTLEVEEVDESRVSPHILSARKNFE